jgi:CheY-like chemotaxis protein
VVEDNKLIRELVVNVFMYCVNRNVLSFENGVEAWKYLTSHGRADIVVADVDMPKMNGFELLSKIKKKYPGKICIIMSGDPSNEKSARELGADSFLAKPFNLKDLFNIVQTYVAGSTEKPKRMTAS